MSIKGGVKEVKMVQDGEIVRITKYDECGNEIYLHIPKTSFTRETKYNDKNQITQYKDSDGKFHIIEYDEFGNCTHFKDESGFEYWDTHNKAGKLQTHKTNNGCEYYYSYDKNGNEIEFTSKAHHYTTAHDIHGNVVYHREERNGKVTMEYSKEYEYYEASV